MLMCDSTDKVDYIARLILLLFEKAPTIINADQELLVSDSREEQGYLKNSIEQFLQHYMRLSKKRSTDVFQCTLMAITYMLKNQANGKGINAFYVLGVMADSLSLQNLEPNAIYSMSDEEKPISFNLMFFEFFAHYALRHP